MKIILRSIPILSFFCLSFFSEAQTFDNYRSVEAYAVINESNTTINIRWKATDEATAYRVYRRDLGSTNWGTALVSLSGTDSSYMDSNIEEGKVYEYAVRKTTDVTEPFSQSGMKAEGYGYISAAINKPANHYNGIIFVLVAENIKNALPQEISQLHHDLIGDGWDVLIETVPSDWEVSDVREFIDLKHETVGIDALYLLGNIPVPYSGTYCQDENWLYPPDGHYQVDPNSHCGAWAADVYYGVIDGQWTDIDSTTLAKRPENNNAIGDGKFDNNQIPGDVTIAVGRVDLSRLNTFSESEIELTKRYLDKAHQFKMAQTVYLDQAIIENNFSGLDEGFAGGAYRDFTAYYGPEHIVEADIFNTTASNNYLFSYGAGAGWYTSCSGYGNTADFTSKNPGLFSYIFGSFFGDYDIEDNFMRASLASEEGGLVSAWNGRPKWVTHTLAIGESFGDVAIRTQNNVNDYDALFYQKCPHIALLGDPSLRTAMIAPPTNIQIATVSNNTEVELTWTASTENDINGYYIYHSTDSIGGFELINETPFVGTTYTDVMPWNGDNYYMIRTSKTTTTGSGSYENLSIGNVLSIDAEGRPKGSIDDAVLSFKVYPTFTNSNLFVDLANAGPVDFQILNQVGQIVLSGTTSSTSHKIDVNSLAPGAYFIKLMGANQKFIKY